MHDPLHEEQQSTDQVFDGKLLHVFRDEVRLPDGKSGVREYIKHPGAVLVIPVCDDGRLIFEISREDHSPLEAIILGLGRFRRPIRDYFAICDSYYQAIKTATAQQIETVDMARRGLHNEAAEMLMDRLDGKIAVDFDTARRLFTLICVLHIKG